MLATVPPAPITGPSAFPLPSTVTPSASTAPEHTADRTAAGVIAAAMVEDALANLLRRYSDGTAALDVTKLPVQQPEELVFGDDIAHDDGTGSSSDQAVLGEEGSLEYAKELYRRKGHLPALKNPREEERRRVLRRYSLHSVSRVPAIDQLAKLARDVFQVDTVVINVVLEDRVLFVSTSGWDPKEEDEDFPRIAVDRDASFCPHAMSKTPDAGCFQVPDAARDWRFRRSPLVDEGKGPVGFFASSNINLRPVPLPDEPEREAMPVGSLCLVHRKPKPALSEAEERMLKQLAVMAANQFELAFEKERHRLNDLRNDYTADLFRRLMVHTSRNLAPASLSTTLPCAMSGVCDKVREHTGSDYCFVLDLRAFNFPSSTCGAPTTPDRIPFDCSPQMLRFSPSLAGRRRDPSVHGPGHISVMDVSSKPCDVTPRERDDWSRLVNSDSGTAAVASALTEYHDSQRTSFALPVPSTETTARLPTSLSDLLPEGTTAAIAVPVFDHEGEPALFMVCGSTQPHFVYEPSDEPWVSSIGAILIAGQSQERILAADKAKTSFVGHISHELRTPLFALGSQLELIRTITDPAALATITPLLDVAETCLTSLREILDDTLDYTKLSFSNGLPSRKDTALCEVDLESLIVDVVKSCASKAKDLARLRGMDDGRAHEQVPLMFRSAVANDTRVKIDVGGFKRVLINLMSNAMKFTDSGSITIAVSTTGEAVGEAQQEFIFEVIDTGKGMDSTFVRDDLLTPFKQKDPFAPGAGLGTSIADNIVKRMGGSLRYRSTLGRGTTASVNVPLEVVSGPVVRCDDPVTRNLTQELEHLFNPLRTAGMSRPAPSSPSKTSRSASAPVPSSSPPDEPQQSRIRCLVVDDNAIARRVLVTYLKTKKIEHAEADGGAEAIELFKSFKPNLVWCDIQMPDVDGIEASRAMREHEHANKLPPARIIAISGLDSSHANHADIVASGQVDEWFVKAGSSLRTLAVDLVKYDTALAERDEDKLANGVSHLAI